MPASFAMLLLSSGPQFLSYVYLVKALDDNEAVPYNVSYNKDYKWIAMTLR